MRFVWIPESMTSPVIYAPQNYNADNTTTNNPWNAMQFETKEACGQWCLNNPNPRYIPIEHGFA